MKIIQVNKRQISEVVGADFDYLDNGDFKEFNGHSEVYSTGKIDKVAAGLILQGYLDCLKTKEKE